MPASPDLPARSTSNVQIAMPHEQTWSNQQWNEKRAPTTEKDTVNFLAFILHASDDLGWHGSATDN